jgi:hypothetical protein
MVRADDDSGSGSDDGWNGVEREEVNRRLILKLDFIALLFPLYSNGVDTGRLDMMMDAR